MERALRHARSNAIRYRTARKGTTRTIAFVVAFGSILKYQKFWPRIYVGQLCHTYIHVQPEFLVMERWPRKVTGFSPDGTGDALSYIASFLPFREGG